MLVLAGAFLEGVGLLMLVPLFSVILGPATGGGIVSQFSRSLLAYLPAESAAGKRAFDSAPQRGGQRSGDDHGADARQN